MMHLIKLDEYKLVESILNRNQYLVMDYDYQQMSGLHWSCKKDNLEISELLLKKGSDVNAQDELGRTPLFFAIQNSNLKLVKLLLYYDASPWSTANVSLYPLLHALTNHSSSLIPEYIRQARQLSIYSKMINYQQKLSLTQAFKLSLTSFLV